MLPFASTADNDIWSRGPMEYFPMACSGPVIIQYVWPVVTHPRSSLLIEVIVLSAVSVSLTSEKAYRSGVRDMSSELRQS